MTQETGLQGNNLPEFNRYFIDQAKTMIRLIISDVLLEIHRLTNAGLNAYGVAFSPYSSHYAKKKRDAGKNTSPDMQWSSAMMRSLIVQRRNALKYSIVVSGTDRDGVSNAYKLAKLETIKNYIILRWTSHYNKIIDEHMNRFTRNINNFWSR